MRTRIARAAVVTAASITIIVTVMVVAVAVVAAGAPHRATASLATERPASVKTHAVVASAAREHALILESALTAWRTSNPAPVPAPAPQPVTNANSTDTPTWACIREYESGDVYNSPTEPSGAYGMLYTTWISLGYSGWPYQASPTVQNEAALYLYNEFGWTPWSTKTVCGL